MLEGVCSTTSARGEVEVVMKVLRPVLLAALAAGTLALAGCGAGYYGYGSRYGYTQTYGYVPAYSYGPGYGPAYGYAPAYGPTYGYGQAYSYGLGYGYAPSYYAPSYGYRGAYRAQHPRVYVVPGARQPVYVPGPATARPVHPQMRPMHPHRGRVMARPPMRGHFRR